MRPVSRGSTVPSRPVSRQAGGGHHIGLASQNHQQTLQRGSHNGNHSSFMSIDGNSQQFNTTRTNENPNIYTSRQSSRGGNRGQLCGKMDSDNDHQFGRSHGHGGIVNGNHGGHNPSNKFRATPQHRSNGSGIPAQTPRVGVNGELFTIMRAPVSPLGFDLDEVPCWSSSASIPADNLQSSTSHQQRGDMNKQHSFLPGLLNSKHLENNIRLSGTRSNANSNPNTARLKYPVSHQKKPHGQPVHGIGEIKDIPSYSGFPQHNKSGLGQGQKSIFQSGQKSYQIEDNRRLSNYERNISTAAPALASSSRFGGNNTREHQQRQLHDQEREGMNSQGELPVEPWAFRIIEKYSGTGSRPVSRTSSRISRAEMMEISSGQRGQNVEAVREDLLRVKSMGRFT